MGVLGRIGNALYSRMLTYRAARNGRPVHNGDGAFCGSSTVAHPENVWIGKNTCINAGSYLIASEHAKIAIGDDCLISYTVDLRT